MTVKAPLPGQPISSSQWLQPAAAAINRLEHTRNVGQGPSSRQAASATANPLVASAIVVGEGADTFTAQRDSDLVLVTVAKPQSLRGQVGTRINSDGDTEEIFPRYFPGARVTIAAVFETGVANVALQDLNVDARRWTIEV